MSLEASPPGAPGWPEYLFGNVLAVARRSWIRQLSDRVEAAGYPGYRATDAGMLQLLTRRARGTGDEGPGAPARAQLRANTARPMSIGELGSVLGVTRQAARKMVDGLNARGYATASADELDGRRALIELTPAGRIYADAIVRVMGEMGDELRQRVGAERLEVADGVLRAILSEDARDRIDRLVPGPGRSEPTSASSAN